MVCGTGFIGFSMLAYGLCETLCLADINPLAIRACERTIRDNGLRERVSVYLSDNLRGIPSSEQWDLIVSNPPHFTDAAEGDIRSRDAEWRIAASSSARCRRFSSPTASSSCKRITAGPPRRHSGNARTPRVRDQLHEPLCGNLHALR